MSLTRLPITHRAGIVRSVDARELHAALGIVEPFESWLRAITTDSRWYAGVDFAVTKDAPNPRHKAGRVGAALSIDVARHCLCVAVFGVAA
jgi:phage anti-repressor protein